MRGTSTQWTAEELTDRLVQGSAYYRPWWIVGVGGTHQGWMHGALASRECHGFVILQNSVTKKHLLPLHCEVRVEVDEDN